MAELTVKDLKAVLDDNTLDLNMRNLEKIPVKALRKLPRATQLDFSTNTISVIPPEFCLLTHITHLDLSSNKIHFLPDNFGNLSNLNHLDLYKNYIEELPLSFGNLSNLKWLDLKNNPLQSDLHKICGDCSDGKSCKNAAYAVVRFMRRKVDEQKALIEKQNLLNKQIEDANARKNESHKDKSAKKKKKEQKKSVPQQQNVMKMLPLSSKEKKVGHTIENKKHYFSHMPVVNDWSQRPKRFVLKFFAITLVFGIFVVSIMSYLLYNNCSKEEKWIPWSGPLCKDLHALFTNYNVPKSFWNNLWATVLSSQFLNGDGINSIWTKLQEIGCKKNLEEWSYYAYSHIAGASFLIKKYIGDGKVWYDENMPASVSDFCENLSIASKMFCAIISDLVSFVYERGAEVIYTLGNNVVYYMEHREELYDKLSFWWKNMK